MEIKATRTIDDEKTYVVVARPIHGSPVAYYISAKSFLLMRRERKGGDTSVFENYRKVAGEMVPFKTTYITPGGQRNVYKIRRIAFDVPIVSSESRSRTPD